jgi:teichuronic acid biosynthesis glycosyltransferase TuaC
MRIWIMTKRQYMRRDLINDRYGRFFALANELSALGNQIVVSCISYRQRDNLPFDWDGRELLEPYWSSWCFGRFSTYFGPGSWRTGVDRILDDWRPDAILACSDAFQVILASRLARSRRLPLVVDLYDNFESYPATNLPGVRRTFRRAVCGASGISMISKPLDDYVRKSCDYQGPSLVLENAVDKTMFVPKDRRACRVAMGLPEQGTVIGTVGALDNTRDIDTLYAAFRIFRARHPGATLALAGGSGRHPGPPQDPGIRYFGDLSHDAVAVFYGALDAGVICLKPDSFGQYCFPQKAVEMTACGVPFVAARTGALARLMESHPECLYTPGKAKDLARSLEYQLSQPRDPQLRARSWREQALRLHDFMLEVLQQWGIPK